MPGVRRPCLRLSQEADYHVSWAQVRVIAAQPRIGKGDAQISDLGVGEKW